MLSDMEEGYELRQVSWKPTSAAGRRHRITGDNIHQELAGLFSQVQDRLEAVGRNSFFG